MLPKASKNQKAWYSGKKKYHTIKTQVIIERKSRKVLDVRDAPKAASMISNSIKTLLAVG
jgi:hypothetical protein